MQGLFLKRTVPGPEAFALLRFYTNAASRLEVRHLQNGIHQYITMFVAIDVWAVGIILMFFLSGKFPLFASNDDVEALMEIAAIIGRRAMEKSATLHSKSFSCLHFFASR